MTAELVCAPTDPAWLERRREGITATDIVTIAGDAHEATVDGRVVFRRTIGKRAGEDALERIREEVSGV